jgi:hypothetical protein
VSFSSLSTYSLRILINRGFSPYRERARTLLYNLPQKDRVVVHKCIVSGDITPKELSLMSSTDLANEATKQSIKAAEKEALEHSILQKTKVPTAKITHKGLQDIENENVGMGGEAASMIQREQEDEERRDRVAALRQMQDQRQQRRASITSVTDMPPESPVVPQTPTWGRTESPLPHQEPELNLADLINIDEEPSSQDVPIGLAIPNIPTSLPDGFASQPTSPTYASMHAPSPVTTASGISPFASHASKEDSTKSATPSFHLSSLWTAPADANLEHMPSTPPQEPEVKEHFTDLSIVGQEADDRDFDMFLDEKDQDEKTPEISAVTPEDPAAKLDALPQVWSGKVRSYSAHLLF